MPRLSGPIYDPSSDCRAYNIGSGNRCTREPTGTMIVGCVHGHVSERRFCDYHWDEVRSENMRCGDCAETTGYQVPLRAVTR